MLHRWVEKVPTSQVDHQYWILVISRSAVACMLAGAGVFLLALTASPAAAPTRPFATLGSFEGDAYTLAPPSHEVATVRVPSSPVNVLTGPSPTPEPAPNSLALVEVAEPNGSALGLALPTPEVMPIAQPPTPSVEIKDEPATPVPTLSAVPTETYVPTEPPSVPAEAPAASPEPPPTVTSVPPLPTAPPPASPEDLLALELFLRLHRDTIAGQVFEIASLRWELANGSTPRYVLEVTASEAADVFAAQAVEDLVAYGHLLLGDIIRYLGGAFCEVTVESTYTTTDPAACLQAREWCATGASDAPGVSTLTWTYLRGRHTGEVDAVEAWSATP
jgi:hypothetical protein